MGVGYCVRVFLHSLAHAASTFFLFLLACTPSDNVHLPRVCMAASTEPLLDADATSNSAWQVALKYGSLAVFLAGTTGETVMTKRAAYAAYFPSAASLLTASAGVIVFPLIVVSARIAGYVTHKQCVVPWWKPAVVAVGFALHNVLLAVGGGNHEVPGIVVVVLVKFVVPFSMFFNILTLGVQYYKIHWLSLALLMGGIGLTVAGALSNERASNLLQERTVNMMLIVLSTVPLAWTFTFLEKNLRGVHKDLFTAALWMWVCMFQFCVALALVPLSVLLQGEDVSAMWSQLLDGLACFVMAEAPAIADGSTDCQEARFAALASAFFGFAFNLAMPVSTRYGGATLMWFVRAIAAPLAGILFACPVIMGSYA